MSLSSTTLGVGARRMLIGDLERLTERCSALEEPLQRAVQALDAARSTLDAIQEEYNAANQQRQAVQRSLVRVVLDTLPLELLRAILYQAVSDLDPTWEEVINIDEASYSPLTRSNLPYTLAAVCRRWRDVIFDDPRIWASIAFPLRPLQDPEEGRAYVVRARMLLKRSKATPLDVILVCPEHYDEEPLDWFREVLREAQNHVHRWRRARIILPATVNEEDIAFLRHPAPLLEYLSLSDYSDTVLPWSTPQPIYLPLCPALRVLAMMTTFFIPSQPIDTIVDLNIAVAAHYYSSLWATLAALPSLQRICFNFVDDIGDMLPGPTTLRCASLQTIIIHGRFAAVGKWIGILETPKAESLELYTRHLDVLIAALPFIEGVSGSERFQSLTIGYLAGMTDAVLPIFRVCHQCVRTVRLRNTAFLDETFFESLTLEDEPQGSFLPRLETIMLETVIFMNHKAADSFGAFVRRWSLRVRDGSVPPFKVVITTRFTDHVPPWLVSQLSALLGDNFVPEVPTRAEVADLARLSPQRSESEANFIDGD